MNGMDKFSVLSTRPMVTLGGLHLVVYYNSQQWPVDTSNPDLD